MTSIGSLSYTFILVSKFFLYFRDHPRKCGVSSRINGLVYEVFSASRTDVLQVSLYEIFNTFILNLKTFQPGQLLLIVKTQAKPKIWLRPVSLVIRKPASNINSVCEQVIWAPREHMLEMLPAHVSKFVGNAYQHNRSLRRMPWLSLSVYIDLHREQWLTYFDAWEEMSSNTKFDIKPFHTFSLSLLCKTFALSRSLKAASHLAWYVRWPESQ